jgi:hypothetical protein
MHDCIRITYIEEAGNLANVQYPEDAHGNNPRTIECFGITTREQALRQAQFEWYCYAKR